MGVEIGYSSVRRRTVSVVVSALVVFLAFVPAPVMAHGVPGSEATLEGIPSWLYLTSGAGIILASFAIIGVFAGRETGEFSYRGRSFAADLSALKSAGRVLSVGLYVGVVALGLFGPNDIRINPAPSFFTEVYWWVSYSIFAILVGNIWPYVNPWKTIYEWAGNPRIANLTYPRWLGTLPALVIFLLFGWLTLVVQAFSSPLVTGLLALGYGVLMVVGMSLFGAHDWLWHVDSFTRVFDFFGRFAPLEITEDGVEIHGYAVGLVDGFVVSAGEVLLVIAMLYMLSFDGFTETPVYLSLLQSLSTNSLSPLVSNAIGGGILFMTGFAAFVGAYIVVSWLMTSMAGGTKPIGNVMARFVLTLVPIAVAYHLAHYTLYYLLQHELLLGVLLSPLPGSPVQSDPGLVGFLEPTHVWYYMVALIVVGHVIAVWVAHHVSLEFFETRSAAIRSQIPMMGLMVFYTIVSLWIISQPFGG